MPSGMCNDVMGSFLHRNTLSRLAPESLTERTHKAVGLLAHLFINWWFKSLLKMQLLVTSFPSKCVPIANTFSTVSHQKYNLQN